jgi:hypothetical protein
LRALPRGFSFSGSSGSKTSLKPLLFILVILAALLISGCGKSRTTLKTNRNGTLAVELPGYGTGAQETNLAAIPSANPEGGSFEGAPEPGSGAAGALVLGSPQTGREITLDPAYRGRNEVVEIKEKLFLAQTNDVYLNPEEYLGKTIKLEGIFQSYDVEPPYYFVIRYGPGCCGNDGYAGFEVAWNSDGPGEKTYPEENDWVEAVGVLGTYEEDDYPYLCIALSSLTVKQERGAEFVAQ